MWCCVQPDKNDYESACRLVPINVILPQSIFCSSEFVRFGCPLQQIIVFHSRNVLDQWKQRSVSIWYFLNCSTELDCAGFWVRWRRKWPFVWGYVESDLCMRWRRKWFAEWDDEEKYSMCEMTKRLARVRWWSGMHGWVDEVNCWVMWQNDLMCEMTKWYSWVGWHTD